MEQQFQDRKIHDNSDLYMTGHFRHLKHIGLQYQQTVDALVAHGVNLSAQDDQVGHSAGKEMKQNTLLSMLLILPVDM